MTQTFFHGNKSDSGFILASSIVILIIITLFIMCLSSYVRTQYRVALREYEVAEVIAEAPYDAR